MTADYTHALVAWIEQATKNRQAPMLCGRAERRVLRSQLVSKVDPVIADATAAAECRALLMDSFPTQPRRRFGRRPRVRPAADGPVLDKSLPVIDGLRAAIAERVASAVRARPDAWCRADGTADPAWPTDLVTTQIFTAMRQATLESVVSYLQARGFITLTFGYYAASYRENLARGGGGAPGRRKLKPIATGAWEVWVNAWKVFKHFWTVTVKSIYQAFTETAREALRSAPAMLAVIIFLFVTGDAWKIFGTEAIWRVACLLAALIAVSLFFFLGGTERADDKLIRDLTPRLGDVPELAKSTPASFWVHDGVTPNRGPLSRAKARNVNVVYGLVMMGNFLAVGLLTMLALIGFGLFAFDRSLQTALMGPGGRLNVIVHPAIAGHQLVLSWQLVMVSLMLAGIAVLSFAVSLQSEDARTAFCEANVRDLQSCVSAFYYYRTAVEQRP